jgi:hypothetical protein
MGDEYEDVKPTTKRDHSEIRQKKEAYGEFMKWGSRRGVLKDLSEIFHVENPPLKFLVPIAQCLSAILNVELDRQDKRRRELLVGWFNKNYERIAPVMPHMILIDGDGRAIGPRAEAFQQFRAEHPCHSVLEYLNDEKDIG